MKKTNTLPETLNGREKMKSCLSCKKLLLPFDSVTIPGTLTVRCLDGDGNVRRKDFPFGDRDTGVIRCDEFAGKDTEETP